MSILRRLYRIGGYLFSFNLVTICASNDVKKTNDPTKNISKDIKGSTKDIKSTDSLEELDDDIDSSEIDDNDDLDEDYDKDTANDPLNEMLALGMSPYQMKSATLQIQAFMFLNRILQDKVWGTIKDIILKAADHNLTDLFEEIHDLSRALPRLEPSEIISMSVGTVAKSLGGIYGFATDVSKQLGDKLNKDDNFYQGLRAKVSSLVDGLAEPFDQQIIADIIYLIENPTLASLPQPQFSKEFEDYKLRANNREEYQRVFQLAVADLSKLALEAMNILYKGSKEDIILKPASEQKSYLKFFEVLSEALPESSSKNIDLVDILYMVSQVYYFERFTNKKSVDQIFDVGGALASLAEYKKSILLFSCYRDYRIVEDFLGFMAENPGLKDIDLIIGFQSLYHIRNSEVFKKDPNKYLKLMGDSKLLKDLIDSCDIKNSETTQNTVNILSSYLSKLPANHPLKSISIKIMAALDIKSELLQKIDAIAKRTPISNRYSSTLVSIKRKTNNSAPNIENVTVSMSQMATYLQQWLGAIMGLYNNPIIKEGLSSLSTTSEYNLFKPEENIQRIAKVLEDFVRHNNQNENAPGYVSLQPIDKLLAALLYSTRNILATYPQLNSKLGEIKNIFGVNLKYSQNSYYNMYLICDTILCAMELLDKTAK